jgi:hypothetical protein
LSWRRTELIEADHREIVSGAVIADGRDDFGFLKREEE